ncbi:MAG: hypothetical protein KGL65_09580 [Rhodospirillales bacterium]|nr:hypothetical protein [Rhodospirillales bacterium]
MTDKIQNFLAIFTGGAGNPRRAAWQALPEAEQQKRMRDGIAAWKGWAQANQESIVEMGGPLGKTKKVSKAGIEDISNLLGGYTVVRAASHEEAAALFTNHPHFTIFPGEGVEVMPVLPIPAG